ncbi:hypothetical protein CRG98_047665 [Punica granatum]|uniref:Uncharacterized protein n=1 Tax=Punica granatum TaxID=22663 RepID=A0A2I0HJP7_PUNGR|nr:hypothetical protein CRG98_047665 [Punica granatum]
MAQPQKWQSVGCCKLLVVRSSQSGRYKGCGVRADQAESEQEQSVQNRVRLVRAISDQPQSVQVCSKKEMTWRPARSGRLLNSRGHLYAPPKTKKKRRRTAATFGTSPNTYSTSNLRRRRWRAVGQCCVLQPALNCGRGRPQEREL